MNREFEKLVAREKHIREEITRYENDGETVAARTMGWLLTKILEQKAKFVDKIGRKQH